MTTTPLTDEQIAKLATVPIFETVAPDVLRWIVRRVEFEHYISDVPGLDAVGITRLNPPPAAQTLDLLTAAKQALAEAQAYADEVDGVERHQAAVAALAPIRDAIAKAEAGLLEATSPWEPLTPERLDQMKREAYPAHYWVVGKDWERPFTATFEGDRFQGIEHPFYFEHVTHIMAIATPEMPK